MDENRVTKEYCQNFFKDKSVLIVGSGPGVINITEQEMDKFDLIVRVNNYYFFNENHRVNVYYSFLGNSIRKTKEDLVKDNVSLILCKCPNEDIKVNHADGSCYQNLSYDCRFIYNKKYKDKYFIRPYYIASKEEFNENNLAVGQIMSSGTACIFDILRFNPARIHIGGFDWFASKKYYKGEIQLNPFPKRHYWKSEMRRVREIVETDERVTAQADIIKLFQTPDDFWFSKER